MKRILLIIQTANTLALGVFINLKLFGIIDWSWLWVLSPYWIPIGLALIAGLLFLLVLKIEAWLYPFRVLREAKKRAVKKGSYNPKPFKTKYIKPDYLNE